LAFITSEVGTWNFELTNLESYYGDNANPDRHLESHPEFGEP